MPSDRAPVSITTSRKQATVTRRAVRERRHAVRSAMERRRGRVSVIVAISTTTTTVLPVFLVAGLSVQLGAELSLTTERLGVVVACYWAASALMSTPAGRVSEAWGARRSMFVAATLGAVSLTGAALATPAWQWVIVWLVVAGIANAVGHPPSNALLAARVSIRNRALAFGIKQAAIPLATLLAGLAVPTLALTVGWRATLLLAGALAALVALGVLALVPGDAEAAARAKGAGARLGRPLMLFLVFASLASALGSAQANVIGAFTVTSATDAGFDTATAGLILSLGSVAGIIARPLVGVLADRGIGGSMATVAVMLGSGAAGLGGMSLGLPAPFAVGCVLAFGFGWGWNGLVHYVASHLSHPYAARATGIVQTGAYLGSAAGPLAFGFVFHAAGSTVGWLAAAGVACVATLAALAAYGMQRSLTRTTTPAPESGDNTVIRKGGL